jgi:acetyltransferase-like isoleucine patch superfamily enzyme
VNIRAAGGEVVVGRASAIGQHSVVVAGSHQILGVEDRIHTPWDESKTGVVIGDNVWIGANCVLLPGCRIGHDAVIGAGSVVGGVVPAGELWSSARARRVLARIPGTVSAADGGPHAG